jgi:hypothetical protein
MGSASALQQLDPISALGFPNYRRGDSGVFLPGLVVGFRMVSGVRRVLANANFVGGMSGGPVLGPDGAVVGVVVTGARSAGESDLTENHAFIPIEALALP